MNEAEKTIKRIQAQKGVEGVIVVNAEGIPIESNLDHQRTLHYTYNFQQLLARTQRVMKDLDPQNEATLLDVQTEKNNILISTGKEKYTYVMLCYIPCSRKVVYI
uniref:Roadblock/LAMTOR2 domain-containing protein n=1 Tax=Cyprinus carpio TaxID=7962 RepID=A0A8C2BFJ3_CYPCA